MRKGFTLIEVLVIVVVTPSVALALGSLFATLVRDIPQTTRVLQQNTTVLNLLGQLRRDMDRAVGLPEQWENKRTNDQTLLIEVPDGVVSYRFGEGEVLRTSSPPDGQAAPGDERVWKIPKAIVTWRPWKRNDAAYAVEIHSHVQQRVRACMREKLAGSHVFFIQGLGKDLVAK